MNNLNERSSKEELLSAACECIDTQQQLITELQQRQTILMVIAGATLIWCLL